MSEVTSQDLYRSVLILRFIAWFLVGVVVSVALVVVIAPSDVVLLVALAIASGAVRVQEGQFGPRLTPMLIGVGAFSSYTLIWVLTLGS